MATLLRTVFERPDTAAVQAQMWHVLDTLEGKFPKAAAHVDTAQHDLPALTAFPREIWRQIWSDNPREWPEQGDPPPHRRGRHLPRPHRPDPPVGAVLAEQNDEWTEARRYMGIELLAKARLHLDAQLPWT